jgi:DNA primase
MDFHYEISPNWKDHYDGKIASPEELYREDVRSTMRYLKLRKIRRLMEENQQDLGRPHTDEELTVLVQTHRHLKEMERELLQDIGAVIVK